MKCRAGPRHAARALAALVNLAVALLLASVAVQAQTASPPPPPPPPPNFPAPPPAPDVPPPPAPTAAPVSPPRATAHPRVTIGIPAAVAAPGAPTPASATPESTPTPSPPPSPSPSLAAVPPQVITRVEDHQQIPTWLIIALGVSGIANLAVLGAYINHRRWARRTEASSRA